MRERHQHHHDQEEQHADAARRRRRGSASRRSRTNSAASGAHAAPPEPQLPARRSSPIGPWVAATIRPPPARCARISPASRSWAARSSAEVGSSSSQIGRCDRQQPCEREPPPLPGGEIGGRQVGQRRRARPRRAPFARSACSRRRRDSAAQNCEVFRDRQGRLQRVLVAEIVGLLGEGQLRVAAGRAPAAPPADPDQAGDHAQQRGFAGAVAAGDQQRLAAGDRKTKPGKDLAAARGRRSGRSPQAASHAQPAGNGSAKQP